MESFGEERSLCYLYLSSQRSISWGIDLCENTRLGHKELSYKLMTFIFFNLALDVLIEHIQSKSWYHDVCFS